MKEISHGKTTKVLMLEGETLFNQGDKGDKAYMIVSGVLDVLVDGKKVGSMRDGEVFGEMALILQQNRSATITSAQSTELISISNKILLVFKPTFTTYPTKPSEDIAGCPTFIP